MIPRMTTQVRPQTLTCQTRKTAIFSYTGGDKKNQKTKETDLRAKSASKEEDEDHNDDEGPGGGLLHCECVRLRDGAGPPGR